jgi:hypothetical protein
MISKTKNTASVRQPNTGRILGTAALALASVLMSGANAKASTTIVTPTNFASSGWSVEDIQAGGTAGFSSAQPRDGNGSYELSLTTDNGSKATLSHTGGDGLTLSAFDTGTDSILGFDAYKDSSLSSSAVVAPAFHLYIGGYSNQLVWEASDNVVPTSTNAWDTLNIKNGQFWARTGGTNYAGAGQTKTLHDWLSSQTIVGTSQSINFGDGFIKYYSVGLGAGWQGSYQGYVDNVKFGATTSNFENASAAPEPSQWAGLGFTAFGALGLILKARKKKSAVSAS